MTKIEPLKCARKIYKVLAIGIFLFFFCFVFSAKADAPPTIGGTFLLNTSNVYNKYVGGGFNKSIWKIDLGSSCKSPVLIVASNEYSTNDVHLYWNGVNLTLNTSTPKYSNSRVISTYFKTNVELGEHYLEIWQTNNYVDLAAAVLVCGSSSDLPFYEMGIVVDNSLTTGLSGNTMLLGFMFTAVYHYTGSSDDYFSIMEGNGKISGASFITTDPVYSHTMTFTPEINGYMHYFIINGGWTPTEYEDVDFDDTYKIGTDYTLAKNVYCGSDQEYCTYDFGYSYGVLSRSITSSTNSDLPDYPRFRWFYEDTAGEPIVSSTIRYFIDVGQTALNVKFAFPLPTSSPAHYVIQIEDPTAYEDLLEYDVMIYSNISTSTADNLLWCDVNTLCKNGLTFLSLDGFICLGKITTCYLFTPTPESKVYINNQYNQIFSNFPFSIINDSFDILTTASATTSTITAGNLAMPFYNTSTQSYQVKSFDISPATTSSDIMEKIFYIEAGFMWIITIIIILFIIFIKI